MIALQGDLAVFSPVDVLQFLGFVRARGALEMSRGAERARIFFEDGRITGATGDRPLLGSLLREGGFLSEADLEQALEKKSQTGRRLGDVLTEGGLLSQENLEAALEDQVARAVFGLLKWQEGRFEFRHGVRSEFGESPVRTPLDRLLFEGLRRMDEEASGLKRGTG